MSKIRILVLTSSTGAGHDARAAAFAEWCYRLYGSEVDVRIEQMLEKSSFIARTGVNFYNWIQQRAPWLHTAFYALVEFLSLLNRKSVSLGRAYYVRVLLEYRPHLVFSVHDCLNRGYFQLARKLLGAGSVRCATYCGEFSGGWGYSVNWVEPSADLYFSRTATAADYAVKQGLPRAVSRVRGHLMSPRAHLEVVAAADRAVFLTGQLGLRPDRLTVFLATGGNGANNHLDLLPYLLPHADRIQTVVVCGRNHDAYNALIHWRTQHPGFGCYVEGFSDIVHLLLQVSDAVVTRGGTTTCAKALHFKCPIIFNALGGIMPQETLTWKYFRAGGAPRLDKPADFGAIIDDWMRSPQLYEDQRRRFLDLRYEEDPSLLIDELVGLAGEAAGLKLERQAFPLPAINGHSL